MGWETTSTFTSDSIKVPDMYHKCNIKTDRNTCKYYLKNHLLQIIKNHSTIKTICLCGSTFYKDCFDLASEVFELNGILVLRPSVYSNHDKINLSSNELDILMNLFRRKINMCDALLVLDINRRIGIHTAADIAYAKSIDKDIIYLSKE